MLLRTLWTLIFGMNKTLWCERETHGKLWTLEKECHSQFLAENRWGFFCTGIHSVYTLLSRAGEAAASIRFQVCVCVPATAVFLSPQTLSKETRWIWLLCNYWARASNISTVTGHSTCSISVRWTLKWLSSDLITILPPFGGFIWASYVACCHTDLSGGAVAWGTALWACRGRTVKRIRSHRTFQVGVLIFQIWFLIGNRFCFL